MTHSRTGSIVVNNIAASDSMVELAVNLLGRQTNLLLIQFGPATYSR